MLIDFNELRQFRGQVAMIDGAFDPLHHGHIAYFTEARKLGLPLLCNIASDDYLRTKHEPLLAQKERAQVIDALASVTYTHPSHYDTETVLNELRPVYYIKGNDWQGRLPAEQLAICAEHNIGIVYLDTVLSSSSNLLERHNSKDQVNEASLRAFEKLLEQQTEFTETTYTDQYFTDQWREGGHSYSLESRREIEAKHPEIIKHVFKPKKVLDVGCGPGALMYFLWELGIQADGIDLSEAVKSLAPKEVRDRIMIGSVTEPQVEPGSYDLVICREVLEHLTVLQVRQAVRQMCLASSWFVYLTTRFHPAPANLLDVTTEFEVDPTHITLMNKTMLRLMFILEGFRQRPDLEAEIDWLNKGRVLVYEKH